MTRWFLPLFSNALIELVACQFFHLEAHAEGSAATVATNPLREAYFGDLHLHTSYSFDAYLHGGTVVDPEEAYRFAKGDVVRYFGSPVRRDHPLDFLAITDHAENIGVFNELEDPGSAVSRSGIGRAFLELRSINQSDGMLGAKADSVIPPTLLDEYTAFIKRYGAFIGKNNLPADLRHESSAAWTRAIDLANRYYEPGKFTTFIAYEWTAAPYGSNLHRNVIFRGSSAPQPFTAFDSKDPEDLWNWLQTIRTQGFEALAIPHNSNASNGLMYDWVNSYSAPIDRAYAEIRQANEPLSEISQHKGSSETHPLLSPDDEFADYEIIDVFAAARHREGRPEGSYLRDALSRGLVLARQVGANPFKYGFVGGSDLHGGLSISSQAAYGGSPWKINLGGGKPTQAQAKRLLLPDSIGAKLRRKLTSGSLTGVWAKSNSRDCIYDALRRRETFATTGTRLKFRFFGGWSFNQTLLNDPNWVAAAYARGVPMGSDMPAKPNDAIAPTFVIWAIKDPDSGGLDRAQVVKVWEDDGRQMEKVFDVVWAGNREPDASNGKLPSIGNSVDLKTGLFTKTSGATELKTVWRDPQFNPHSRAAYYLRVLEIPTPRWTTLLAIENGLQIPKDVPPSVQQRGWSSPIWYTPTSN